MQGVVKWFNNAKGFGFIIPDDGSAEVFAHFSAIQAEGYKSLNEGQRVEYVPMAREKGTYAAEIRPLKVPALRRGSSTTPCVAPAPTRGT